MPIVERELCVARWLDAAGVPVGRPYDGVGQPVMVRLAEKVYARFVQVYGFDVAGWDGYGVLRDMRELYITAWLAQNLAHGPAVVTEVATRIESIRDGDTDREWHAF